MALLAHLGENFLHVSSFFCHEQGAARAIARAELPSRLLGTRVRPGGEAASRRPFPPPLPTGTGNLYL